MTGCPVARADYRLLNCWPDPDLDFLPKTGSATMLNPLVLRENSRYHPMNWKTMENWTKSCSKMNWATGNCSRSCCLMTGSKMESCSMNCSTTNCWVTESCSMNYWTTNCLKKSCSRMNWMTNLTKTKAYSRFASWKTAATGTKSRQ